MMLYLKSFLSTPLIFIFLCLPFGSFAQQNDTPVAVLNEKQEVPAEAKLKGHIKLGYEAFRIKCDNETIIAQAKEKARSMGGNIVKITKSANPDAWNSCYRIKAEIFFYDDVNKLIQNEVSEADSISRSLIPDTAHYALLYIYRPTLYYGVLIGYNVHMGKDSIICRAKNGSKYIIKVFEEGPAEIWGATESRWKVKPNIKFGRAYFIRCTIKTGIVVGEPSLQIVNNKEGIEEFNKINFDPTKAMKDDVY